MKPFFLAALLGWLLLPGLAGRAAAQCTINTPPCATPFVAIDVATGQEVQAFCVGRAVRFDLGCGRSVAPSLLYYNALTGTNTTPPSCDFTPGKLANNTFTPTAAGAVTISELANPSVAGGTGTVYVRNFQVYGTPAPKITVQACARNSASLTITTSGYDSYFAQVDNGPQIGPLTPGTVSLPAAAGSTITVTGRYTTNTLCSGQASAVVPTLVAQQPRIPTLTVRGPLIGPIDFTFSGLRFSNTTTELINDLQVADPATPTRFRSVVAFSAPTTYSQSGPQGLYRLANYDPCGLDSTFSEPVPAINLTGASANNANTVTWLAFGPVASYVLLRNGTPLATLPAGTSRYVDAAVTCGAPYTYRLQATTVGGSTALSNEVTVQTTSTLAPPAPLLNASFDLQNHLTLTATQASGAALPAGGQLRYNRQGGPGALDFAAVPTATDTLRDPAPLAALLAAPPCYTVRLQDVCGNTSAASPATCPVLLAVAAADPEGLTARLSWSAFQGPGSPAAGVRYRVLTLAPDGTVLATSAATTGLTYLDANPPTDRQVLRYRVEASGSGLPAGTVSYSNVASLARQPRLVVPNAFTPNGDGLNDVLELKGRYLSGFTFVVVDRNGQEVFRATDRGQTWDGTIRGHAPVNGAYVWRFAQRDETGQDFSQTGTVTILK
ncbi:gliding motility-associated C-terminal domain-containing protein [Hymenobacter sp. BRD128]|uniref:T9SS type B sorting domain-containing protein n=1 Tax=Hymenobacter sp. BRD128 TaxID=2675878 RepID=UPI001564D808|nr:gliding motility-associated C-terminal domain-containing protein [Hymenobacter sp. BRD128]QKG55677.1 gliding motility-associated C-terminal domain-containing protein [Hymenobacter sp. BRD128]